MIKRNCNFCGNEYEAEQRYLKRGQGLFCTRSCATQYRLANKPATTHNVFCALCSTSFYMNTSKQKNSKSGLFFCCRTHKDTAQRLGGVKEIMPDHYGRGEGVWSYRTLAFSLLPNECAVCGWNEYPDVLEVNHKDLNRNNNVIENLEILCPTHHQVFHYLDGSGRWAKSLRNLDVK